MQGMKCRDNELTGEASSSGGCQAYTVHNNEGADLSVEALSKKNK